MKIITINSPKYGIKEILVDDEDFDFLNQWNWSLRKKKYTYYAKRNTKRPNRTTILMHRVLTNAKTGEEVDHKNGNGLDNQKHNIRSCSISNNSKNKIHSHGTSKYLGVCAVQQKIGTRYRAKIKIGKKQFHLGNFINETDAAKAYDAAAKVHHKEFANLNFK